MAARLPATLAGRRCRRMGWRSMSTGQRLSLKDTQAPARPPAPCSRPFPCMHARTRKPRPPLALAVNPGESADRQYTDVPTRCRLPIAASLGCSCALTRPDLCRHAADGWRLLPRTALSARRGAERCVLRRLLFVGSHSAADSNKLTLPALLLGLPVHCVCCSRLPQAAGHRVQESMRRVFCG